MADIVVIMDRGEVQQVATPLQTYRSPANAFVADFIGISNLIPGVVSDSTHVEVHGGRMRVERLPDQMKAGSKVSLSVRPEEVHIRPAREPGENRLPGTVTFIRDLGASVEITAKCGDLEVLAVTTPRERPQAAVGDAVAVELPIGACVVLQS